MTQVVPNLRSLVYRLRFIDFHNTDTHMCVCARALVHLSGLECFLCFLRYCFMYPDSPCTYYVAKADLELQILPRPSPKC